MSQCTEIVVVIQGIGLLLEAAAQAGAEILAERQRLETADGKTHQVDYVLGDGKAVVGVRVDPKTEQAVLLPQDCDAGPGVALAGRIAQRYAYSRVLQELKAKGYQVAREEKARDGSVKLVLQRWR